MKTRTSPHASLAAFTLVELALALGLASFCLVSVFGLLSVGFTTSQAASAQTSAQGLVSTIVSELRATAAQASTSQHLGLSIPPNPVTAPQVASLYFTGSGVLSSAADPQARYLATVTFLPNGAGEKAATLAQIKVSWPAAAKVENAAGKVSVFEALDRN